MREYTLKYPIEGVDKKKIMNLVFRKRPTAGDLVKIERAGGKDMGAAEESLRLLAICTGLDYQSEICALDREDVFAAIQAMNENNPTSS